MTCNIGNFCRDLQSYRYRKYIYIFLSLSLIWGEESWLSFCICLFFVHWTSVLSSFLMFTNQPSAPDTSVRADAILKTLQVFFLCLLLHSAPQQLTQDRAWSQFTSFVSFFHILIEDTLLLINRNVWPKTIHLDHVQGLVTSLAFLEFWGIRVLLVTKTFLISINCGSESIDLSQLPTTEVM